jgi:DNA helicase-2/ATP-dependent DNA helicase PcrA
MRLKQTISIAQEQLFSARLKNDENKAAIISAKKELKEDTVHSISNLWSSDSFEALVELSQHADPVLLKVSKHQLETDTILALDKMLDSPYFARIDFKFEEENEFEKIYIGRSTLIDDKSHEIFIYDWRTPVASMFYRFGAGQAFYEAPIGKMKGEIGLKRQYEIKKGKLEYFFDADIQVVDEFLRKLLSQSALLKMKTIVETIQKDQDIIIRDMEMDLMMVQGAAGSGKTSVALHRVAYLMYAGLSNKLSHNDIVVISPNTLFEQYISSVLPELGEKNVDSIVFDDIFRLVLQEKQIQPKNQFLEDALSSSDKNYYKLIKSSMKFKGSSQFIEILERFIGDLANRWIEFSDIYYDGKLIVNRQLSKDKILRSNKNIRISRHLRKLENSILELVHEQRKYRLKKLKHHVAKQPKHAFEVKEIARMLSILESTALIKNIRKFTELDCFKLYEKLFNNKKYFYSLAKGIELPDCIEDIIDLTRGNLNKDVLHYDDAVALTFLHLKTKDFADYRGIKQVVIDEAQDYYPVHFEILNLLFSGARFTILGDINQTIGKQENLSLYDKINKILDKKKSALVTLDKCFRSTNEILMYSTKFLDHHNNKLNSFSRKGEVPVVFTAPNRSALDDMVIAEILTCKEKGHQSIALICKTEQDSALLYGRLKGRVDIQLIKNETGIELKGVFVLPVYMSKGLEFDAVLICDADNDHYFTEDDKNLLYIACTRALHRLNLFYAGEISPLL